MKFSNEFIFSNQLSSLQHEVMIGGLLGDFSLEKQKRSKFPRLKVDRQLVDKSYIEWQFNIFKDLCKSNIKEFERYDKRYDKHYKYVSFRTRAIPAFLKYYNEWYVNGIRQVPDNLILSPLILAVWFADDGCIVSHGSNSLTLKISIESFGEFGANILSFKLEERFKEKFPIYRKKKNIDQFFIKASTYAAQALLKEIEPFIIEMNMIRKYNIWKNSNLNLKPKIGRPPNKIIF